MAIGLGRMMGFTLPENFNMPYLSGSITEFWRRWHMTLSAWLRDYLYIPLGGNRKGSGRTVVNLMVVMVLGGLWHGAAWSFVVWGAWHGAWLVAERLFFRERASSVGSPFYRIVTIVVVLISWILFRAEGLGRAMNIVAGFAGFHGLGLQTTVMWQLTTGRVSALVAGLLICVFEPAIARFLNTSGRNLTGGRIRLAITGVVVSLVFVVSVLRVAGGGFSPFLYFRF
jgi:alginate O-acetyltransferase complex protein AlgI